MDDDIFFYYHFLFFFFCKHSFRVQSTNNNKPIYGVWFICLCSSNPWEDLFCTCKRLFTTYLTSTSQRITNLLWKDYISLKLVPTSTHIYKTVTFSPPSINDAVLPLIFSTSDWITYLFHWKKELYLVISFLFYMKNHNISQPRSRRLVHNIIAIYIQIISNTFLYSLPHLCIYKRHYWR